MHLGVVPQRLIMAGAFHRGLNRFPVQHRAFGKGNIESETVRQLSAQYFQVNIAHGMNPDLPAGFHIFHLDERLFLLQGFQAVQHIMQIGAGRRYHAAGVARAELLFFPAGIGTQPVPGKRFAEPDDAADLPRGNFLHGRIAHAGIQPDFSGLFRPERFTLRAFQRQKVPGFQRSAGDPQESKARALRVPGHFVNPGTERGGRSRPRIEAGKEIQQRFHALVPQGGAGEHRKNSAAGHHGMDHPLRNFAFAQIGVQAGFVAQGQLLRIRRRKLHNLAGELPAERSGKRCRVMRQIGFVQEEDYRQSALLQEPPERPGMRLDTVGGADDQHSRVQNIQRAFGFTGKVGMPRRVHQRQVRMIPGETGFLREDRDAAVFLHPVGIEKSVAVIHTPLAADGAGKEEHGFRERGFARVHMSAQPDHRSCCHAGFLPSAFCMCIVS